METFYWEWRRSDFNPLFTPDGRSWDEQDPLFYAQVWAYDDWIRWADWQAEHPSARPVPVPVQTIGEL